MTAPPAKPSTNAALRAAAQIIEAQKMLLRAGLRVLRVESAPAQPDAVPPASMEEVFDRRVASALLRMGMPDAAELTRIADRLEALETTVDAMQRKARRRDRP